LGGIKAVIWTDAIQGIVLIGGALVCSIIIMFSMPEGPSQVFTIALEHNKFSLGSFGLSLTEATFWVMLIYGLFINLQNYGIDQNYVQRYMTTKSEKEAKSSALFGSLLYIPVSLMFFFIGTALFAYFQASPDMLPADLQSMDAADRVFPYFIVNVLPTGLTGLLIASVFAAGMSTVSTSVNSSATIILTDYYKRYVNPSATNKQSMKVLYGSSVVFGVLGVSVGTAMISVKSALDAWWMLASIFSGGMLGLFLLGYFVQKAKNVNAAIGAAIGVLVILWMSLSPLYLKDSGWENPFHPNLTIVFGTTVIFLVGFLLAQLGWGKKEQPTVKV
jgi:solute:Na+ symporter, SSS family